MGVHHQPHPDSVVYAIAAGWRIKIGTTRNLDQRMREIQSSSPLPIVCLGTAPGGRELELALHRQFGEHRVHGEWFELVQADRAELLARLDGKAHFVKLGRRG